MTIQLDPTRPIYLQIIEEIKKHGVTVETQSGFFMQSTHFTIANKMMVEMRKWLVEFGCTPSSRTGVKSAKPESKNPLKDWLDN